MWTWKKVGDTYVASVPETCAALGARVMVARSGPDRWAVTTVDGGGRQREQVVVPGASWAVARVRIQSMLEYQAKYPLQVGPSTFGPLWRTPPS